MDGMVVLDIIGYLLDTLSHCAGELRPDPAQFMRQFWARPALHDMTTHDKVASDKEPVPGPPMVVAGAGSGAGAGAGGHGGAGEGDGGGVDAKKRQTKKRRSGENNPRQTQLNLGLSFVGVTVVGP